MAAASQKLSDEIHQRETHQRRLVYDQVMSRCNHPTADDIFQAVHAEDPKVSKGTVYRNLSVLAEAGDILQVKVPGASRFDSRLDRHCHLLCTSCGMVIDAPLEYMEAFDAQMSAGTGFKIARHRTVFEGICPACQKKEESK